MEGKKEMLQEQLRRKQCSALAYEYAGWGRASGHQRPPYLHLAIFLRQLGDVAVAHSFISGKELELFCSHYTATVVIISPEAWNTDKVSEILFNYYFYFFNVSMSTQLQYANTLCLVC